MIKHIIALLLVTPAWIVMAQLPCNLQIRGIVLDATDSAYISNAEVFIEQGHLRTYSGTNGKFSLKNVCSGLQLLEFEKSGFEHVHAEIKITIDTFIYIWMFPKTSPSDTIRLTAFNAEGKTFANEQRSAEIQAGGNLAEALAHIPGISLMQGGKNQSKPILRGMYGLRLPIISVNFRLEGQQWGNDHNPEADPNSFEQITIVRDADALLHSHDGHFGNILLRSAPAVHEGESSLDQSFQYGSNGHQLASKTKFVRQADEHSPVVYGTASFRKAGNYSIPGLIIDNTGLEEFSLSGGVKKTRGNKIREFNGSAYRFEGGIFTGTRAGNVSDLLTAINREIPQSSNRFTYQIGAPRQVSGHVDLQYQELTSLENRTRLWSAGFQYDQRREFDFHRNSKLKFPQLDLYLLVPSFKYEVKQRIKTNTSFTWGSALSFYHHRYGGYYFLPDFSGITTGTYAELAKKLRKTHISLAMRGDAKGFQSQVREMGIVKTQQRRFVNYSSAFTVKRKLHFGRNGNPTLLSMNASRTWRAPWLNELYSAGVHHGAASFEKGNPHLQSEICYRVEGLIDVSHKNWQAFISPFLAYMKGFINLSPMSTPVVTVRGVFPGFEYNQGDLSMYGVDAGFNLTILKHFTWRGDVNYIYQRYSNSNRYPAFIPPVRLRQHLEYRNNKFSFQLGYDYTFKQQQYTPNSDFLPPPKAFGLWSLRINGKSPNSQIGLEITNALNILYRSYMDRFRYFMPMPGRNISLTWQHQIHHHTKKHSKP